MVFLPSINQQLLFFTEGWNQHRIQIRDGPNRSPADMFGFDMLVHGIRGSRLPTPEEELTDEELEVYGVDWEGLDEAQLLLSLRQGAPSNEASTSWIGRTGPPENLNEVNVDQPPVPSNHLLVEELANSISGWIIENPSISVEQLWQSAVVKARWLFGQEMF